VAKGAITAKQKCMTRRSFCQVTHRPHGHNFFEFFVANFSLGWGRRFDRFFRVF
jgi:hypothetical protein